LTELILLNAEILKSDQEAGSRTLGFGRSYYVMNDVVVMYVKIKF